MRPSGGSRTGGNGLLTRLAALPPLAVALVLASASAAGAQSKPLQPYVPQYTLEANGTTPLGGLDWLTALYPTCDAQGNVYLRILPGSLSSDMFTTPVTEFSSDGERKTTFSLAAAPGWAQGEFIDFAVSDDGNVYLLADRLAPHRKVDYAILGFDRDGSHILTAPLDFPVYTYDHIAAFSTGEFLVIGGKKAQAPPPRIPGTPITAKQLHHQEPEVEPLGFVVHDDGRLIQEVVLPADPLDVDRGKATGPPLVVTGSAEQGRAAVVPGTDGNIYLMIAGSVPFVYAISSAGKIVHSFAVQLPSPAYTPIGMKWAGGLGGLLIESAAMKNGGFSTSQMLLSVVDTTTGQRIADYHIGPELGVLPACFNQRHIYFVASLNGKMVLREAEPR